MNRTLASLRPSHRAARRAWLCAVGLACAPLISSAAPPCEAGQKAATSAGGKSPAKATAKTAWTQAASKHGGSGVDLRYSVTESLRVGVATTVELQFLGVSQDDAGVEVRAPSGAVLSDALGAPLSTARLPRGQITTLSLRVTPSADGMQYLDVFTTQGGRSSAQSVPLKVGSGAVSLKANGQAKVTPEGERVISMPAQ